MYYKQAPIRVKGGIKPKNKRSNFSSSWWGKRWIEALESFQDTARLARGRSYARKGQVLSIQINDGEIIAKVQGSRSKPYKVNIEVETFSLPIWHQVIEIILKKAIYTASLLSGNLPKEIEDIFSEENLAFFPSHHQDLRTDCTCPDWSNPCKHISAVLYLLSEEFDRDPFLLFKIRGLDKKMFFELLEKKSKLLKPTKTKEFFIEQEKPISLNFKNFWNGLSTDEQWLKDGFEKPEHSALLIKSLNKFPFWQGENNFQETLENIYDQATDFTIELLKKDQ